MLIKSIKRIKLEEEIPVYDITVPETENFCLASGVVIHNSKDVSDAVAGVVNTIITHKDEMGQVEVWTS